MYTNMMRTKERVVCVVFAYYVNVHIANVYEIHIAKFVSLASTRNLHLAHE